MSIINERRRMEIDRLVVKYLMKKETHFGGNESMAYFRSKIGRIAKEVSVPVDELLEYYRITLEEIFQERLKVLGHAVLDSKINPGR